MSFFNEFPHTRNYDSDLAWLIERMKEVLAKMGRVDVLMAELERILAGLPYEMRRVVIQVLNEMLLDGSLETIISQSLSGVLKFPNSPAARIRLENSTDYSIGQSNTTVVEDNNGFTVEVLDMGGYWGFSIGLKGFGEPTLDISVSGTIVNTGIYQSPIITLTEAGSAKFSEYPINHAYIVTETPTFLLDRLIGSGAALTGQNNIVKSFTPENVLRWYGRTGAQSVFVQKPLFLGAAPKASLTP